MSYNILFSINVPRLGVISNYMNSAAFIFSYSVHSGFSYFFLFLPKVALSVIYIAPFQGIFDASDRNVS